MRQILFIPFLLILFSCSQKEQIEERKPNVILINVDDLGWSDLGYMGSNYYETPNIDSLSKEGVVFFQAYAGASNCAPSRATMLTGTNTPAHGIYTVSPADRGNPKTRRIVPSHNENSIKPNSYTLGNLFKDQGYVTASVGKWHVSENPKDFGFDVNVAGSHRGNPGKDGYFSPFNVSPVDSVGDGEFLTDVLTSAAIDFVEKNQEKPFFLYLPFYTVHTPLMAKEEDIARFAAKTPEPGRSNATYAAMIYNMDQNVGRLLSKVSDLGLAENTIIIFTSDNGGIRAVSYQDPLRAGKGSYYEGGIRVPMIVSWAGKFTHGEVQTPVSQMDFFPTLKELIGAEKPLDQLEGESFLPLLKGEKMEPNDLYWHFPIYLEAYNPKEDGSRDPLFRTRPGSVIRSGDWKLHQYFEDGGLKLYNLKDDVSETNNLVESNPEKAAELLGKLNQWRERHQAPVPTEKNPEFDSLFEKTQIEKVTKDQ
ncbi:sulfatase [Algoriphagus zhangzhouensis]|uniref:Arylsulfatase A n=1 Tax=Algoriphagus zhangzhouensis TaxID=1073327 RepID=A0A1M7ZE27_9BACT|nr:sulfatase [Algoriphagus zhangzhouensis]TDY45894.1 arylsulfatase A-like enzyme [Algoriphagus zhangzhouensis]SHO63059.1 Arylsulfatase A [Algoriphagus zhangzhouensis]